METTAKPYAKVIRPRKGAPAETTRLLSEEEEKQERVSQIVERRARLESVPDKLAGHKLFFRNWYYEGGKAAFPKRPSMWFTDRYYPLAEGGPIAMDCPESESQMNDSLEKAAALSQTGVRFYIVDRKNKTLEEMIVEVQSLAVKA